MATVVGRAKQVAQPRGGYINPRTMDLVQIEDGRPTPLNHKVENVHASLVGMAVDYMTRLLSGTPAHEAFKISLIGASLIREDGKASALLHGIKGLDHASLVNACKLVGYDVVYRAGVAGYRPVETIEPDMTTTANIAVMIERSLAFFESYGPITLDGFTFPGAFTELVTNGDGDFLTADTLWDFKVSVSGPTKDHTLQLLMYLLMGQRSGQAAFDGVRFLGVFNPRLNAVYRISLDAVGPEVLAEVSRDVIGY